MAKQQTVTDDGPELVALPTDAQMLATALHYVGDGEYIYGVPARDLVPAEAVQFAAQIAATRAATGRVLYAPSEE